MNETTLTKMQHMKFYGMHGAFQTAIETGKTDDYTIDEFAANIPEAEWDDRQNRKIERAIKNARFRYKVTVENIIYDSSRNIDRTKLMRLLDCSFIKKEESLLITGSSGKGKSYIESALGYQACIGGCRVRYFNAANFLQNSKWPKQTDSILRSLPV